MVLDLWVHQELVELTRREVVFKPGGRRYRLVEAVRVLAEVGGAVDEHELVGQVRSLAYVTELGGEVFEGSMILGDNAYDVIPGFMGTPVGSFAEYLASAPEPLAPDVPVPASDQELLAQYLSRVSDSSAASQ